MLRRIAFCLLVAVQAVAAPPVHVRSYVTKKGEYHAPAVRTEPDKTQRNNYSSKPNVNPYTGKKGTKVPKR